MNPDKQDTGPIQDDFQREEKRALLSLGILAIIVSLLVNSNTLGFPTIITYLFYMVATLWGLYALCMMIYFSDDLFSVQSRIAAKELGLRLLFLYPIETTLIIPTYFLIRDTSQPVYIQEIIVGLLMVLPFFVVNLVITPRIRKASQLRQPP